MRDAARSRREFLSLVLMSTGATVLAACGQGGAPAPAKPAESKPAEAPKPTEAAKPAAPVAAAQPTEAPKPADAAKPAAAAAAAQPSGPAKIRHYTWLGGPQKDLYDKMLQEYMDSHPGIEISHESVAGTGAATYPDVIKTGMAAGSPPDLFFNWGGSQSAPFIDAGGILALDDKYQQRGWDKLFFPWVMDSIKRKGKTWGIPKGANGIAPWYRKDLFDKVGIGVPKTYDELEENNRKLKAAGITPMTIGGKFGWNTMRLLDYLMEVTAGPELHSKLQYLQESWDRKEVVESYKLLKKWIDEQWLTPGFLTVAPNDALLPWYKGDAAMIFGTSTQEAVIKTAEQDIQKYDFFLPPTGQTPFRFGAYPHQLMVAQVSPVVEPVLDLATWISQPDVQKKYFAAFGSTATIGARPDEKEWARSVKWLDILEKQKDVYPPTDQAFYKELMDGYFEVQDGIVAGQITPEDGAKRMQQKAVDWQKQSGKTTTLD
jgi:raffinose/stachyose/melibiose transport system substrate-binding protein